jgi:hypothetical protein
MGNRFKYYTALKSIITGKQLGNCQENSLFLCTLPSLETPGANPSLKDVKALLISQLSQMQNGSTTLLKVNS